jgi:hypothetical protein
MIVDTMTGDNSDTTLTLSVAPVSENNVQVYFDGVYQSKANYSISGTTLTFSTAPATGVAVEAITHTQTTINEPAANTVTPAKIAAGDFYFDTDTLYIDATNNNVGIGTSSPDNNKLVITDSSDVGIQITKSGVVSGSVKAVTTGLAFGVDLASGNTERMRILSSGGITFNGDTATANALDDYEEGTWTPSGSLTSVAYYATYTKIGRVVTIAVHMLFNSSTSTATADNITGLPFPVSNTNNSAFPLTIWKEDAGGNTNYDIQAHVSQNESRIRLTAVGGTAKTYAEISDGYYVIGGSYFTDS